MKKDAEIRYPQSADLFQFCRQVLDQQIGGGRVIDQDVGQILGFDPADCSHWKKGKKQIRTIQAMKSIADRLGVDEKLVVDVASGDISKDEALYEYSGYGTLNLDPKTYEAAKKEFFRQFNSRIGREKEQDFRRIFAVQDQRIDEIVMAIHERISFQEAPLYLPEVVASYSQITIKAKDPVPSVPASLKVACTLGTTGIDITFPTGSETRPHVRYQIAKAMGRYFLRLEGLIVPKECGSYANLIEDIQANHFASKLLAPAPLVRAELSNVNVAKDIVSQLAETFWVSKTFMNRRLKEILQSTATI